MDSSDEDSDIIQNAVYCPKCAKYLVSVHVHDYSACPHMAANGGLDYISRGGDGMKPENDFSLFRHTSPDEIRAKMLVKRTDGTYVLLKTLSSIDLAAIINDVSTCALQRQLATEMLATS